MIQGDLVFLKAFCRSLGQRRDVIARLKALCVLSATAGVFPHFLLPNRDYLLSMISKSEGFEYVLWDRIWGERVNAGSQSEESG